MIDKGVQKATLPLYKKSLNLGVKVLMAGWAASTSSTSFHWDYLAANQTQGIREALILPSAYVFLPVKTQLCYLRLELSLTFRTGWSWGVAVSISQMHKEKRDAAVWLHIYSSVCLVLKAELFPSRRTPCLSLEAIFIIGNTDHKMFCLLAFYFFKSLVPFFTFKIFCIVNDLCAVTISSCVSFTIIFCIRKRNF